MVGNSKATEKLALQQHRALENSAEKAKTAHTTPVLFTSRHAWIGTQSTRKVFGTFDILGRWTIQLFNETASSIEVES